MKPHVYSGGPSQVTTATEGYNDTADPSLDTFYPDTQNLTGANGQPALVMGAAFKGFDDYDASWWPGTGPTELQDKIITQGCGTTWLQTFSEPNTWYNPKTNPLPYMMVETWDDYEEGTEIETGISNCLEDSSFALTPPANGVQSTLAWTFNLENDYYNTKFTPQNTIHSFYLFSSTDGTHYSIQGPAIPNNPTCQYTSKTNFIAASCIINLSSYGPWTTGQTYDLVIQALGQATITNHISNNSVSYVP